MNDSDSSDPLADPLIDGDDETFSSFSPIDTSTLSSRYGRRSTPSRQTPQSISARLASRSSAKRSLRSTSVAKQRTPSTSPRKFTLQDYYLSSPEANAITRPRRSATPNKATTQTEDLLDPWRIRVIVEAERNEEDEANTASGAKLTTTKVPLKDSPSKPTRSKARKSGAGATPMKASPTKGRSTRSERRPEEPRPITTIEPQLSPAKINRGKLGRSLLSEVTNAGDSDSEDPLLDMERTATPLRGAVSKQQTAPLQRSSPIQKSLRKRAPTPAKSHIGNRVNTPGDNSESEQPEHMAASTFNPVNLEEGVEDFARTPPSEPHYQQETILPENVDGDSDAVRQAPPAHVLANSVSRSNRGSTGTRTSRGSSPFKYRPVRLDPFDIPQLRPIQARPSPASFRRRQRSFGAADTPSPPDLDHTKELLSQLSKRTSKVDLNDEQSSEDQSPAADMSPTPSPIASPETDMLDSRETSPDMPTPRLAEETIQILSPFLDDSRATSPDVPAPQLADATLRILSPGQQSTGSEVEPVSTPSRPATGVRPVSSFNVRRFATPRRGFNASPNKLDVSLSTKSIASRLNAQIPLDSPLRGSPKRLPYSRLGFEAMPEGRLSMSPLGESQDDLDDDQARTPSAEPYAQVLEAESRLERARVIREAELARSSQVVLITSNAQTPEDLDGYADASRLEQSQSAGEDGDAEEEDTQVQHAMEENNDYVDEHEAEDYTEDPDIADAEDEHSIEADHDRYDDDEVDEVDEANLEDARDRSVLETNQDYYDREEVEADGEPAVEANGDYYDHEDADDIEEEKEEREPAVAGNEDYYDDSETGEVDVRAGDHSDEHDEAQTDSLDANGDFVEDNDAGSLAGEAKAVDGTEDEDEDSNQDLDEENAFEDLVEKSRFEYDGGQQAEALLDKRTANDSGPVDEHADGDQVSDTGYGVDEESIYEGKNVNNANAAGVEQRLENELAYDGPVDSWPGDDAFDSDDEDIWQLEASRDYNETRGQPTRQTEPGTASFRSSARLQEDERVHKSPLPSRQGHTLPASKSAKENAVDGVHVSVPAKASPETAVPIPFDDYQPPRRSLLPSPWKRGQAIPRAEMEDLSIIQRQQLFKPDLRRAHIPSSDDDLTEDAVTPKITATKKAAAATQQIRKPFDVAAILDHQETPVRRFYERGFESGKKLGGSAAQKPSTVTQKSSLSEQDPEPRNIPSQITYPTLPSPPASHTPTVNSSSKLTDSIGQEARNSIAPTSSEVQPGSLKRKRGTDRPTVDERVAQQEHEEDLDDDTDLWLEEASTITKRPRLYRSPSANETSSAKQQDLPTGEQSSTGGRQDTPLSPSPPPSESSEQLMSWADVDRHTSSPLDDLSDQEMISQSEESEEPNTRNDWDVEHRLSEEPSELLENDADSANKVRDDNKERAPSTQFRPSAQKPSSWFSSFIPGWWKASGLEERPAPVSPYNHDNSSSIRGSSISSTDLSSVDSDYEAHRRSHKQSRTTIAATAKSQTRQAGSTAQAKSQIRPATITAPAESQTRPVASRPPAKDSSPALALSQVIDEMTQLEDEQTQATMLQSFVRIRPALPTFGTFTNEHYEVLHAFYQRAKTDPALFSYPVEPPESLAALEDHWIWSGDHQFGQPVTKSQLGVVDTFLRYLSLSDVRFGGSGVVGFSELEIARRLFSVVVGEQLRSGERAE